MTSERRRGERFSLELQARVTYRHSDQSPLVETVSADISDGGAFLQTDYPFHMASKIQVEFLVGLEDLKRLRFILSVESLRALGRDSTLWVKTTAVVIRQNDQGIAVIFDKDYTITPMKPGGATA